MFRHIAICALIAPLIGCAAADGAGWDVPRADGTVRVATYNIHHWVGRDDVVDIERIARVIESLDVDVVVVQEADNNLVGDGELRRQDLLTQHVDGRWVSFDEGAHGRVVHGNAVLVRPEVDIVSADFVDVSEPDRDPRAFTNTVLEVRGQRVRFVGAHFGLNGRERARQVKVLAGRLEEDGEVDGTVVMGDFNEWNPLANTFGPIRDLLREIRTARSFPSGGPMLRLDRIFASDHVDVEHVEVVLSADSSVASDHLPVRAELIF